MTADAIHQHVAAQQERDRLHALVAQTHLETVERRISGAKHNLALNQPGAARAYLVMARTHLDAAIAALPEP